MSIFNKIRDFAEYHDVMTQFDRMLGEEIKLIESYDAAFNKDYETFVTKQADNYNAGFKPIGLAGHKLIDSGKELFLEESNIKPKFGSLKSQNEDYYNAFISMQNAETNSRKLNETATKEENKLTIVRAKGNPTNISKQEGIATAARTNADSAQQQFEEARKTFNDFRDQYKKNFVVDFSTTMKELISIKKQQCTVLEAYGNSIIESVPLIHYDENERSMVKLMGYKNTWDKIEM